MDLNRTGEVKLDDCVLYYLSDEDGQTQIEITYNNETPKNGYENGNAFGHFAFEAKSMEDLPQKWKNSDYKYLYEPFSCLSKYVYCILERSGWQRNRNYG